MPSLMDKLRMMDAGSGKPPVAQPTQAAPQDCYQRSERYPLNIFAALKHMNADALCNAFGLQTTRTLRPEDLLFLDTETTGLSGGAGTVAFEVGVGYLSGGHFVVEQFLMRDYPEEPFLLHKVGALMRAFPVLVTFNGRTFDAPLLQTRFQMNRIPGTFVSNLYADVLHAARRVWKLRLGSCTLQRLESVILGIAREDDLPGKEVPQTYFRYLQNGDFAPLERILLHNRQDVVSLAQLFFFLCRLFDKPETAQSPEDLIALAKAMEKRGVPDKAQKCYRLAAHGAWRTNAFQALAAQEKRKGNAYRATRLYAAMLARGDDPVAACEGLAKLYEHQLGSVAQALAYTRQALLILSEPGLRETEAVQSTRNALQYRYARLRRRLTGDAKS